MYELLDLLKDGTHGTHKDVECGPLLLSAKNIKQGKIIWDESDRRISRSDFNSIHAKYKLKEKDVLLTIVGSIGETAILRECKDITFQRSVAILRTNNKVLPEFLYTEIQTTAFQNELNNRKSTSAQPGIYLNDLKEIFINLPANKEEQLKIGAYFEQLDNLITLHQRQCEALKKQKQFFLQNMFPKEGESEPRIRFNGFTEPWEQRKFKDFTKQTGIRNKENLDLEPYSITNETGFVPQKDAHDEFGYMKNTDRSAYSIVSPNSFAYNPARINVGSIGYYKGDKNVIVSSLYEVFQTDKDIDDSFLWIWFKSSNFFNWINKLQEGSVRQYFYYDKLCECKLPVPSLKEQEKIGTFFSKLDNLITLHQRQYEQLVSLKKYLLSKMFI